MVYNILKVLVRCFYFLMFRVEITGIENVPKNEGALLCPNHISNHDPFLIASHINRKVRFMAKYEAFQNPFLGFFLRHCEAYPIKRGETDITAFKMTLKILKNDEMVGLFPEGHRVRTGELGKVNAGMGLFSIKSGKKVIPVAVSGEYKFRSKVKITIGEPMDMSKYKKEKMTNEDYLSLSELVMKRIQTLLRED